MCCNLTSLQRFNLSALFQLAVLLAELKLLVLQLWLPLVLELLEQLVLVMLRLKLRVLLVIQQLVLLTTMSMQGLLVKH
jgi:hypothetical protein